MTFYEATQKQRAIERKIRYWKRQASGLEAAGLNNSFERLKIGEWQTRMRKFTKETGLNRQSAREQVAGVSLRGLTKKPEVSKAKFVPSVNITENVEAREAAKKLLAQRVSEEPGITSLVRKSVKDAGGKMEGLEYRLKSEDSLTRKIVDNIAEKNISAKEAVNEIFDVNRYTGIFNGKVLINQAKQIRGEIEKNGFKVVKVANTFGKRGAYQGLHFVFKHSDGRVFELQFHTPQSIKIKNEIHEFYEEFRVSANKIRKNELARKMIEKWAGFIPPDDWKTIVDFKK